MDITVPERLTTSSRRPRWRRWLVLFGSVAALQTSHAAESANCVVTCDAAVCVTAAPTPVRRGDRWLVANCPQALLADPRHPVNGLYQTARGPERFKVTDGSKPFGNLIPALARAGCLFGGACLEERDASRRGAVGGMGADEDKTVRQGRPCEAGLPCGQVLLPKERLVIDVPSVASGQLTLKAKRGGGGAAATFPVRDGRIEVPATALAPGAVYAYTLQGASGGAPLSGEFALLSSKMQSDIERAIDEVRRADPDGAALGEIEILVEEKLQWDATQRLR